MKRHAVLGEGAVALFCLNELHARGFPVVCVLSPDGSLTDSAEKLSIRHETDRKAFFECLRGGAVDVLWSVANPWVLTEFEIGAVQHRVVNYHDSLLPLHAGMHATTWALLEGRQTHGVSWHEVDVGIDTGRLLAQMSIPVLAEDRAFDLNARCLDAACRLFIRLIEDPTQLGCVGHVQSGERSYHAARHRLPFQCNLNPEHTALSWIRQWRSHDFGPAKNPLGLPKLCIAAGRWLIVQRLMSAGGSTLPKGHWQWMDSETLVVGTADGTLAVGGLLMLDGRVATRELLGEQWGLGAHGCLHVEPSHVQQRVSELHGQVCLFEGHWRAVLRQSRPVVEGSHLLPRFGEQGMMSLPGLAKALRVVPVGVRQHWCLSLILLHALRSREQSGVQYGLHCEHAEAGCAGLFAHIVPVFVPDLDVLAWSDWLRACADSVMEAQRHRTFAFDLLARMHKEGAPAETPAEWATVFCLSASLPEHSVGANVRHVWWLPDPCDELFLLGPQLSQDALTALDDQLSSLCRAALSCPEADVRVLGLMEPARQLAWWSACSGPVKSWTDESVVSRVMAMAKHQPHAIALVDGDECKTYEDLIRDAQQHADELVCRGVQPGHLVGLHMPRGVLAIVCMLAIWQVGAAWMPLDPEQPEARLLHMISQAQPALVLSSCPVSLSPDMLPCSVLVIGDPSSRAGQVACTEAITSSKHDGIAYCIFTSGSTGQPKGVLIEEAALLNHLLSMADVYRLSSGSRCLWSASIGFDVTIEQVFPALISGGTVEIRPADLFESVARFDDFVRVVMLTHLTLPTAIWHAWVHHLKETGSNAPATLKVIGVGTERVDGRMLSQWWQSGGHGVRFFQGYGPTEATVTCTFHEVDSVNLADANAHVPIGRPLPNASIHVVDHRGHSQPAGATGEILVSGAGLARGYVNQPELTADRFIYLNAPDSSSLRAYKTGDIGYVDEAGRLFFLGRKDAQVKVNGHRVELGEIETVACSLDDVTDALVVLHHPPGMSARLVGHVVAPAGAVHPSMLQDACERNLPAYMRPVQWFVHDHWQLTLNGKIDRKALPVPDDPIASGDLSVNDPPAIGDELLTLVAEAFKAVLGIQIVGLDSSFFSLGGDSLAAMRLLGRLQADLGVHLGFGDLAGSPTIRLLCERIRAGGGERGPRVFCLKDGSGPPVWLLAGVFLYQDLTRALQTRRPVFVAFLPIEEELLRGGMQMPPIQDIARRYVDLIVKRTPVGPYVVGGFSVGGAIAHAVARQLVQTGRQVELVVILDTTLPTHRLRLWHWKKWKTLLHSQFARKHSDTAQRQVAGPEKVNVERASDAMRKQRDAEYARILQAYEAAGEAHDGPAVIYRTTGEDRYRRNAKGLGFAALMAGEWAECLVDSDHIALMKMPSIALVALDLSARLDRISDRSDFQQLRMSA